MKEKSEYKGIFKSTFLFSAVRVIQIILAIIKNKVVAILLGPEGVGIIGILSSSISLLQTGGGLGVSQSAVRDISEANSCDEKPRLYRTISLTYRIIFYTCLFGCLITIFLSPQLSKWTFGDRSYTIAYLWLSIVVGLNILTEGQMAILKGMRQLRAMAKASIIGSIVGLFTAVPMYYFFGKAGIVPSLIITAISSVFFSNYFVRRIKYDKIFLSRKKISKESSLMLKMGVALMFVDFLSLLFDLVIAAYIRSNGGLEIVGYYRAGTTIITNYFGIVLTAMTTDYYPRISAVHFDNDKLQEEVNKQSEVGLILIFPMAVIFVFLSPLIMQLLYTKDFIQSVSYTDFAIFGIILAICSNNLAMILMAKQVTKIFTIVSLTGRLILIPIYIVFYYYFGLLGLGISFLINIIFQLVTYALINYRKYDIKLNVALYKQLSIILTTLTVAILFRNIDNLLIKYLLGFCIFLFACLYSNRNIKEVMNIDIWTYIKNKFNKPTSNFNS